MLKARTQVIWYAVKQRERILRAAMHLSIALLASCSIALAADELKAFPPAEAGMVRHVIKLPQQQDESAFKVELIVGKKVKTDAGNRYFFLGTLETEDIPGWGYTRYILHKLGPMAGTLMAVDPEAAKVERFISLGGEPKLLRYNSRLPLVVYVPADVEVRHRIWRAEASSRFLQKIALPGGRTAVIAEGEFEARSIGSYSVRIYSGQNAQAGDDTTFFQSGIVRARDGSVEKVLLADLGKGSGASLVVAIRSAGSGGYVSADAYSVDKDKLALRASVSGLPAKADPIAALRSALQDRQRQ